MTTYSVADAKRGLPRLIDRALRGEQVVITRRGRPVAELRPVLPPRPASAATYSWLTRRRDERCGVGMTSIELLDQLYAAEER